MLVATAISFVVTFSGPPPFDVPNSLRSIRTTLKGEAPTRFERGPPPGGGNPFARGGPPPGAAPSGDRGARPRCGRQREAAAPGPRGGETPDAAARLRLAAELRAAPADVVAFTELANQPHRDAFVGSYTFAWRERGGWWVVRSHVPPSDALARSDVAGDARRDHAPVPSGVADRPCAERGRCGCWRARPIGRAPAPPCRRCRAAGCARCGTSPGR
ncbi:hypothetical protein AB5I41_07490 [Sphingomonas sp. MMS24-JH45]